MAEQRLVPGARAGFFPKVCAIKGEDGSLQPDQFCPQQMPGLQPKPKGASAGQKKTKFQGQLETGPGRDEDDEPWGHTDLATNPVLAAF